MTRPMHSYRLPSRGLLAAVLTGAVGLAACNTDKLLTVPTPDVVLPQDINTPAALPSAYASALGDFQVAYAGGYGSSVLDNNEGLAQITGLFTDELLNAESFPTRIQVDLRAVSDINSTTLQIFHEAQRARATAELVSGRFRALDPANPQGAEVQALAGFMYVLFAESYCNGVPTSTLNDDGTFTYGPPQSGTQLLTAAIAKFDSAITIAAAAGTEGSKALNLARIGKGRALLDLNQPANAAAAVAQVPSTYNYSVQHSENTGRQNNAIFAFNYLEGRFTGGDREGTTGLPFVSLNDPRTPFIDNGLGFDGSTEQFLPTKYPERKAPTPLAIGSEARLIEAEAALRALNPVLFLAKLNQARAAAPTYTADANPTGIPEPSPDPLTPADLPATAAGQQDLLFQERALTLYLTGHRLGDLRRLVWQYGRNAETVFPTGLYQADNPGKADGSEYGSEVNLPLPREEKNNPNFQGCTNLSAGIT
jgi:hypothetical protein